GVDSFTYQASDGHGGTDTAQVTITVGSPVRVELTWWGAAALALLLALAARHLPLS
ncbi:MAG: hypothetical protein HY335_03660, partial [Deinococcus sp.]|nr:hypothetical protein [Deinococcus sp.]